MELRELAVHVDEVQTTWSLGVEATPMSSEVFLCRWLVKRGCEWVKLRSLIILLLLR